LFFFSNGITHIPAAQLCVYCNTHLSKPEAAATNQLKRFNIVPSKTELQLVNLWGSVPKSNHRKTQLVLTLTKAQSVQYLKMLLSNGTSKNLDKPRVKSLLEHIVENVPKTCEK
jgi:hypothetical protein